MYGTARFLPPSGWAGLGAVSLLVGCGWCVCVLYDLMPAELVAVGHMLILSSSTFGASDARHDILVAIPHHQPLHYYNYALQLTLGGSASEQPCCAG